MTQKRKYIFKTDIIQMIRRGQVELEIPRDSVLTDEARETALNLGLKLISTTEQRNCLVVANCKMNLNLPTQLAWTEEMKSNLANARLKKIEVGVAPAFPFIASVAERSAYSPLVTGAQDISAQDGGAYTGEVSAEQVASCGAKFVILGHSERRRHHQEDIELLRKKAARARGCGLKIIYCIGESSEQRQQGNYLDTILSQAAELLVDTPEIFDSSNTVLAYEPLWAIGTGVSADSSQVAEVHHSLRLLIEHLAGKSAAAKFQIIYGGSVDEKNAGELARVDDIDGFLVGSASLDSSRFFEIVNALSRVLN